jgi:hypothetical protein
MVPGEGSGPNVCRFGFPVGCCLKDSTGQKPSSVIGARVQIYMAGHRVIQELDLSGIDRPLI